MIGTSVMKELIRVCDKRILQDILTHFSTMFHFYTPRIGALTLTHAKPMLHFYTSWKCQCYISRFSNVFREHRNGSSNLNRLKCFMKAKNCGVMINKFKPIQANYIFSYPLKKSKRQFFWHFHWYRNVTLA